MTARGSDRILGLILVAVSAAWCWGVVETIPALSDGSRLGPRGFPLGLGVLLGALGLIVFVRSFAAAAGDEEAEAGPPRGAELWAVGVTVALLVGYTFLLEYTGFLIATFAVVAAAVGPVLGVWRPATLIGMSLGVPLFIQLAFGELLGVYLPHGRWIDLTF